MRDDVTAGPPQQPTVVRQFEEQAARVPDRTAVVGEDSSLTYAGLERLTADLARSLRAHGATPDRPVAVLVRRGALQLAAVLGVLRAGAPYVCLDTDQPESRLAAQLAHCEADIVLTDTERPVAAGRALLLDGLPNGARPPGADAPPGTPPAAGDLAYLLYTSGSSGAPKGVAVSHGALAYYTGYLVDLLGCADRADRAAVFASVTSLSTDLGNTAVFPSLTSGGTLHLVATDVARDPVEFAQYVQGHAVEYMKITPSHLAALLEYPDPELLPRRVLLLGGEATHWELVDLVRRLAPCRVVNHYGPTETTVGSLVFDTGRAGPEHRAGAGVPIGFPLPSTVIRVVDEDLRPVRPGRPGELLIAGPGLARGYWNDPELTAVRFPTLPDGSRVYRTGDRVRQLPDGAVEFLSRIDAQVKIRGHRVEPGEVDAALLRHPRVAQAAVVAVPDASGEVVLHAYATPAASAGAGGLVEAELQRHLAGLLPAYMVPAVVRVVDGLPFTPSGKIDRRALAAGAMPVRRPLRGGGQ